MIAAERYFISSNYTRKFKLKYTISRVVLNSYKKQTFDQHIVLKKFLKLHFTPLIDFKRDPSNAIKISFFSDKKLGIEFLIVEGFLVCGIKYQSGNHVQVYTDKNFCVSWCNELYTTKYNSSSFCLSLRCYISHSINIHPISTVPFLHSLKIFFEQIFI